MNTSDERVYVTLYGLTLLAIRLLGFALDAYARHEHLYSPARRGRGVAEHATKISARRHRVCDRDPHRARLAGSGGGALLRYRGVPGGAVPGSRPGAVPAFVALANERCSSSEGSKFRTGSNAPAAYAPDGNPHTELHRNRTLQSHLATPVLRLTSICLIRLKFLAKASSDRLYVAWRLSLYGLRRGEVLGLRWSDIDHQQVGGPLRLGVHAEDLRPRERGGPATRPGRARQNSQDRLGTVRNCETAGRRARTLGPAHLGEVRP